MAESAAGGHVSPLPESAVRLVLIVFPLPDFDRLLCLLHGAEPIRVQTFAPQGLVEGFDVGVVGWFDWPVGKRFTIQSRGVCRSQVF